MATSKLLIGIISGTIIVGSATAAFNAQNPGRVSAAQADQAAVSAEESADTVSSDSSDGEDSGTNAAETTAASISDPQPEIKETVAAESTAASQTNEANETAAAGSATVEETVARNGWSDGKYFVDNIPATNTWEVIDGQTYRFDADGNEVTGWYNENGNTYYLASDGTLTVGNASINGKNYYFNENGVMQTGWVNGTYYSADGSSYSLDGVLGNMGRLFIPGVGINVALNYVDDYTGDEAAQAICDAEDSAAYMVFSDSDEVWIGDHNYQGFDAIKSVTPGTEAYIKNTDGTITTYICTETAQATNTGYDLVTADGRSASSINAGGIIMYTCNDDWTSVTATFWQPV